ncbi:hypothetical protein ABIB25_003220 [Nakamurella sp. UYEF19]|uniref:uridine kinase n=1 Tax=Nakamurella sp. UYEF19 TaxID=1756392 RepID=UPI0033955468
MRSGNKQARFTPLTPARLVTELAAWVRRLGAHGAVIGFDGPEEVGTTMLADEVGEELRVGGLTVIRASTRWWWRPSALRLEFGRQDVDMRLTGWVDADAIVRELIDPVRSGDQPYITRLRDPETDRSLREVPRIAPPGSVLLLDGPFLLAAELSLDALVSVGVGRGALDRALEAENNWWTTAFDRYAQEYRPAEVADVLLSYDHAASPAASGLIVPRPG